MGISYYDWLTDGWTDGRTDWRTDWIIEPMVFPDIVFILLLYWQVMDQWMY